MSKRLSSYDFRFALKTENLILELMPTGEIYAWPSDTDEEGLQPVYVIPAPYMADQAGAVSTDIRYELIEQAGGYLLKLIADEDWLNAAERSYPVVLDPIIETSSAFLNNTKYAIVYEKGKATETSVSEYVMAGTTMMIQRRGAFPPISGWVLQPIWQITIKLSPVRLPIIEEMQTLGGEVWGTMWSSRNRWEI